LGAASDAIRFASNGPNGAVRDHLVTDFCGRVLSKARREEIMYLILSHGFVRGNCNLGRRTLQWLAVSNREPWFLSSGIARPLRTLTYDFLSFTTFLLFLPLCLGVGGVAHFVDRRWGTRWVERLIRFFEFFAR